MIIDKTDAAKIIRKHNLLLIIRVKSILICLLNHFHTAKVHYFSETTKEKCNYLQNTAFFCKKEKEMEYNSKNRHKFLLKCHLTFVCKYRRNILDGYLSEYIKQKCVEIFDYLHKN